MAKRTVHLVLALPGVDVPALDGLLRAQAEPLEAQRVRIAGRSIGDVRRAEHELMRSHREAGLRRRDVEGAWAEICRCAWKRKGSTVVVSEALVAAAPDQLALLLDGLAGMKVRLTVLAPGGPAAMPESLGDWFGRFKAKHVHLVITPPGADPVEHAWCALAAVVGYDASAAPWANLAA